MKRIFILAMAILVTFSLAACGRRKNNETTAPTGATNNTTFNDTIIPDMDPTLETNIPDPSVDTSMPMATEETENAVKKVR